MVEHRIFEEFSVAATADLLGKTEGAIKMTFLRALEKLASLGSLAGLGAAADPEEVKRRG